MAAKKKTKKTKKKKGEAKAEKKEETPVQAVKNRLEAAASLVDECQPFVGRRQHQFRTLAGQLRAEASRLG